MKTRVRLFVTGSCEHQALPASLGSVFADQPVAFERQFSPEWSFTSTRVPPYLRGEKSRAARLAAALVADVDPAFGDGEVPDLLIAIDDLELCNLDQAPQVVAYFRSAVHDHLERRPWSASDRTRAVERVRERCSLHLLKPMVESYFFGDEAALARAGAKKPSLFDPRAHDVESFLVSDADYQGCAVGDCAARTLDKAMHPKRYLRHLTGHAYKETRGGAAALTALAWGEVLANRAHAMFARSLIADIAAKLSVPNPYEGGCAPETELKAMGLLRNV